MQHISSITDSALRSLYNIWRAGFIRQCERYNYNPEAIAKGENRPLHEIQELFKFHNVPVQQ